MNDMILQGAGIGLGLLAAVVITLLQAGILRALLRNFRPDLHNNSWRNALIVCGVSSLVSVPAAGLGTVAFFILCMVIYRTSFLLTLGLSILMGVVTLGLLFGTVLVLGMLAGIHPLLAVGAVILVAVFFTLLELRQRAQQRRMEEVWKEGRP